MNAYELILETLRPTATTVSDIVTRLNMLASVKPLPGEDWDGPRRMRTVIYGLRKSSTKYITPELIAELRNVAGHDAEALEQLLVHVRCTIIDKRRGVHLIELCNRFYRVFNGRGNFDATHFLINNPRDGEGYIATPSYNRDSLLEIKSSLLANIGYTTYNAAASSLRELTRIKHSYQVSNCFNPTDLNTDPDAILKMLKFINARLGTEVGKEFARQTLRGILNTDEIQRHWPLIVATRLDFEALIVESISGAMTSKVS